MYTLDTDTHRIGSLHSAMRQAGFDETENVSKTFILRTFLNARFLFLPFWGQKRQKTAFSFIFTFFLKQPFLGVFQGVFLAFKRRFLYKAAMICSLHSCYRVMQVATCHIVIYFDCSFVRYLYLLHRTAQISSNYKQIDTFTHTFTNITAQISRDCEQTKGLHTYFTITHTMH